MLDIRYDGILPHNGKKWGYDITHQFRGVPEGVKVLFRQHGAAGLYQIYDGEKLVVMGSLWAKPDSIIPAIQQRIDEYKEECQ